MSIANITEGISPYFYKLAYISLTSLLLGLFYALFRKPLDKIISPKWKYVFWVIVLFFMVFGFRIKSPLSVSDFLNLRRLQVLSFGGDAKTVLSLIFDLIIPFVWLIGCIVSALVFLSARIKLRGIIKEATKHTEDKKLRDVVNECCDILEMSGSRVRVAVQDYVKTPAVTGIASPVILLPQYYAELSPSCLKYVILHELSHFKRGDTKLNLLITVLRTIYWYNPLIHILFKLAREDMELANDSGVLSFLEDSERAEYRNAVFENLSFYVKSGNTADVLCMTDTAYSIRRRIKMLDSNGFFEKRSFLITALCTVIAVIGILLFASSTGLETDVSVEITKIDGDCLSYTFTNGTFGKIKTTGEVFIEEGDYDPSSGEREWKLKTNTVYSDNGLGCPKEEYKFSEGFKVSVMIIDWLPEGFYRIRIPYRRGGITEYAYATFEYKGGLNADSITKSEIYSRPDDGPDAYLKGYINRIIRTNRSGSESVHSDNHTLRSFVYNMKAADWFEGSGCLTHNCPSHNEPLFKVEVFGENNVSFEFYRICDRTADVTVVLNGMVRYTFFTSAENALKIKSFNEERYTLHDENNIHNDIPLTAYFLAEQNKVLKDLDEGIRQKLSKDIRNYHKYLEYTVLSGIESDIKDKKGHYWDELKNGPKEEEVGERAWTYDEYGELYCIEIPSFREKTEQFKNDISVIDEKTAKSRAEKAIALIEQAQAEKDASKLFEAHTIIHDLDFFLINYPVTVEDDQWVDASGVGMYFGK